VTNDGFGLEHLPVGSVVGPDGRQFAAVRFGDSVLDLGKLDDALFAGGTLDGFLAAGPQVWARVRAESSDALTADRYPLTPLADVRPVLGWTIGDYVDFFTSEHHAANTGRIFRPQVVDPLPAAWPHIPLGYDGRAGSIVVSGTEVRRPHGMLGPGRFAASERLDFEAEVAFVVGVPGRRIAEADAHAHVFGLCVLNDWSARDIQAFESAPLGPFLGKSFATSIAAWITPLAALGGHELQLEVRINGHVVSRPPFALMKWTYRQMLTHLTSNGAAVRTGDVFASGTVSGPEREHRGCLLELAWNGSDPIELGDGTSRSWLADGDEVTISATAGPVRLTDVSGRIVRA
jgi:fumarylacetoacetase